MAHCTAVLPTAGVLATTRWFQDVPSGILDDSQAESCLGPKLYPRPAQDGDGFSECGSNAASALLRHRGRQCNTPLDHRLSFQKLWRCLASRRSNRSERSIGRKAPSRRPRQASSRDVPAVQTYACFCTLNMLCVVRDCQELRSAPRLAPDGIPTFRGCSCFSDCEDASEPRKPRAMQGLDRRAHNKSAKAAVRRPVVALVEVQPLGLGFLATLGRGPAANGPSQPGGFQSGGPSTGGPSGGNGAFAVRCACLP